MKISIRPILWNSQLDSGCNWSPTYQRRLFGNQHKWNFKAYWPDQLL